MMNLPVIVDTSDDLLQLDARIIDYLTVHDGKSGLMERSRETYCEVVACFNAFLTEHGLSVGEESLRLYFNGLRWKFSPSSLNLHKYALLKVIRAQVGGDSRSRRLIVEKVFEQIPTYRTEKSIRRDMCLTEDQVMSLIAVASEKTQVILRFLFKTGCRVTEMVTARVKDCEVSDDRVRVLVWGKGRKPRHLEIPCDLYDDIRYAYPGLVPRTWLFEKKDGEPLSRNGVFKVIKRVGCKMGLNISPHTMRHSRATDLHIVKGVSLTATSRFLGHADPSITAKMYVHDDVDYDAVWEKDRV
ncbi:MAG: Integrase [Candidatus Wolfebacteria bacterium GW2011_GWC1_43_10]|uniref:Integrase n=1 Tax=Candidatus Wolfebacteria bacterium GW2011_GWC1_43_10 TaxID=1619011 RepID=A0A0G1F2V4_9BACT|nr:MAG: Integrase [Candidatus Wolfebacteria bacterium GW2011_GWC1_43_10]